MRIVLLSALCSAGCLISPPDGASQSWPPALGMTIEAVSSGDLDSNGTADVVVYASGTASQEGMYLLKDSDIVDGKVKQFSKFVPVTFGDSLAVLQTQAAAPSIYVASGTDKVELVEYTNILTEKARATTTVAATGASWVHPVVFPGNQEHIAVSNGSAIDHVAPDFLDVKPIPAPSGPMWDGAQVATSYTTGADSTVVVATPTTIARAPIPTQMGAMFAWTTVRTGAAWLGQTAFDLDGDGRAEIIGLDLAARQLCVLDPGATAPTPTCIAITTNAPGNEVQILVGNITPNATKDIIIAQASATVTDLTLIEDITYSPGSISAVKVVPTMTPGPAHGRTVLVGPPANVLVFGEDGNSACVFGPC